MNSRKNSINEAGMNVSGIRGLISQGLTRAQHSAMDLRNSVMETKAPGENSRRGSFQASLQKKDSRPQIYVNQSDDVGCMSDFVGIEGGEETSYPGHEYQQASANEGIQIVVQEHIDTRWDGGSRRASQVSGVQGFHDANSAAIHSQSRRGRLLFVLISSLVLNLIK